MSYSPPTEHDRAIRAIAQGVYRAELAAQRELRGYENDDSRTPIFDTDLYELWARAYIHGMSSLDDIEFSKGDSKANKPTDLERLFLARFTSSIIIKHTHRLINAPALSVVLGQVRVSIRDNDDRTAQEGFGIDLGGNPLVWHHNLSQRVAGITEETAPPPHVWCEFAGVINVANNTEEKVTINDVNHPISQARTHSMQLSTTLSAISQRLEDNGIAIGLKSSPFNAYEVNPIAIAQYGHSIAMRYDGFTAFSEHARQIIGNASITRCVADFLKNEFVYWAQGCKYEDNLNPKRIVKEINFIKRHYA